MTMSPTEALKYLRKMANRCIRCGKPVASGSDYCADCTPMVAGSADCTPMVAGSHWNASAAPKRRRTIRTSDQQDADRSRKRSVYSQRAEAGICTRCGRKKAVPGRRQCPSCMAWDRARKNRANAAARAV